MEDDDNVVARLAESDDDEGDDDETPSYNCDIDAQCDAATTAGRSNDTASALDELKRMCDTLAMAEAIGKEHAMLVMRIKSGMELLVLRCMHAKSMELAELRNRIHVERMTIEHKAVVDQTAKKHLEQLEQQRIETEQLKSVLSQVQTSKRK